ncbi:MAG: tRNA (adenosine(37)-N6)-threonylcarbamoyltransferase complex dimerization subunit type 1 TsaB [Rickettsiales bacterium]|nr:tRNA (adenosine(37)-N6)-threonylcarbamoyltransferase complex dimerization subunit type 1 TsaB [Rickettsiales bacterium]
MKILAFDSCNSWLSLALVEDNKIIANNNIFESQKQSELLIVEIEKILRSCNIWYQQLDAIITNRGPSSFTSVRIGLSVARTIAIASKIPVLACDYFEIIIYQYLKNQWLNQFANNNQEIPMIIFLDASNEEFFCQEFLITQNENNYKSIKRIGQPYLANFNNIEEKLSKSNFLIGGSAKISIANQCQKKNINYFINHHNEKLEANYFAEFALQKLNDKNFSIESLKNLEPLYIRNPNISSRK